MKNPKASPPAPEAPCLVPLAEAGKRLGWSYNTAWRKVKDGTLPTVKSATGRHYVSEAVLAELMQGQGVRHDG